MKERSFDEMIAYFNRRVSEMNIAQDYKIELLGMVTALGYKHEKTAQQWTPCSERLPEENEPVLGTFKFQGGNACLTTERIVVNGEERWSASCGMTPIAWMPLPEPCVDIVEAVT